MWFSNVFSCEACGNYERLNCSDLRPDWEIDSQQDYSLPDLTCV